MNTFKEKLRKILEGSKKARGYKTPKLYHEIVIKTLKDYAEKNNLPQPTKILDIGTEGIIFESTNDNILIRAEQIVSKNDSCEFLLNDLQETGGVVTIYHLGVKNINVFENKRFNYVFTWKEKINTSTEKIYDYLVKKYGEEKAEDIKISFFYLQDENNLEILEKYPETQGVAKAVKNGLETDDISFNLNVGLTNDGRIVVFDC